MPVILALSLLSARHFDALPSVPAPQAMDFVLDNVHLIPISEVGVLRNKQLRIQNGRIAAIEAAGTSLDADIEIIDGKGAYVTPGFFDMHVHVDDPQQLRLALSYGITTVRDMDGMPMILRWAKQQRATGWLGASLYSASPALIGKTYGTITDPTVRDPQHARALVKRLTDAGYDLIKVYQGLEIEEFDALVDEANRRGIKVAGHIPYSIVHSDYSKAGLMSSLEHVEEIYQGPLNYEYDEQKLALAISTLASSKASLSPTLVAFDELTLISEQKHVYVDQIDISSKSPFGRIFRRHTDVARWLAVGKDRTASLRREMEYLKHILQQLDVAGVNLLTSTDAGVMWLPIGTSYGRELSLMRDSGLAPATILQAATINGARSLGLENELGTIETGKVADLVLFDANPLLNISETKLPKAVIKRGIFLTDSDLKLLRDSKWVAGWWISTGRYLEALWDRFWLRQLA